MASDRKGREPVAVSVHRSGGLQVVALFEGAKGLIVLLAGFGLLAMIHRDLHEVAAQIIRQFHINPAHHYPRIFLDLTEKINDQKLWALAAAALMYSGVRIIEALGLWLQRRWAEWFGLMSGGLYIPLELYEAIKHVTWVKIGVLSVNIGIVCYLAYALKSQDDAGPK